MTRRLAARPGDPRSVGTEPPREATSRLSYQPGRSPPWSKARWGYWRSNRLRMSGPFKLRGMANLFYRERINQHLQIGLEAIRILRDEIGPDQLHSRKLRSFDEPAFR